MKKLYITALLLGTMVSFAQSTLPVYEAFDYTAGANLGEQNGWVNVNTGDEVVVVEGSLSYSGLAASTGNKVTFGGGGIDPQYEVEAQESGIVYASFIVNISDISAATDENGGYFTGLAQSATVFASTVWLKPSGDGFVFGLNKATSTNDIVYGTTEYNLDTDHFVVVAFDIDAQTSYLWVNPSATDLGGASVPDAALTASTGSDRTSITRFFIRQDSDSETPSSMSFDELRIGTSWASVTPTGTTGVAKNQINGLKMFPNPLNGNVLNVTSASNAEKQVTVYNIIGKQVLSTVTTGTVNAAGLTAGVYIVKITEEGKTATRKLVVK